MVTTKQKPPTDIHTKRKEDTKIVIKSQDKKKKRTGGDLQYQIQNN